MFAPEILERIKAVHSSEIDPDTLIQLCAIVLEEMEELNTADGNANIERLILIVGVMYHQAKARENSSLQMPDTACCGLLSNPYLTSSRLQ